MADWLQPVGMQEMLSIYPVSAIKDSYVLMASHSIGPDNGGRMELSRSVIIDLSTVFHISLYSYLS